MTIQEIIQKIRTAVKGIDVRDSIADGIEKINKIAEDTKENEQQFEVNHTKRQNDYESTINSNHEEFKKETTDRQENFEGKITEQQGAYEKNITSRQEIYESSIIEKQNNYEKKLDKKQSDYETQISDRQTTIENRYDAAVAAHTEDSEVIDARGGEENLNTRLNNITAQYEAITQQVNQAQMNEIILDKPFKKLDHCKNGSIEVKSIKGRTLVNLLGDKGSFKEDDSAWVGSGSTKEVLNQKLKVIADGSHPFAQVYCNLNLIKNHKYFIPLKIKADTEVTELTLRFMKDNGSGAQWIGSLNVSSTETYQSYVSELENSDFLIVGINILMYAPKDKAFELSELMVIDLTEAFGEGNEPSKEWCDRNIEYFEGMKSSSVHNIKTLSKNIFDEEMFHKLLSDAGSDVSEIDENGNRFIRFNQGRESNSIRLMKGKFEENTQYSIIYKSLSEQSNNSCWRITYTDGSYENLGTGGEQLEVSRFVTGEGKTIDYITLAWSSVNFYTRLLKKSMQIISGNKVMIPYHDYDESEESINLELHGVGEVYDSIEHNTHIKRCEKLSLTGDEDWKVYIRDSKLSKTSAFYIEPNNMEYDDTTSNKQVINNYFSSATADQIFWNDEEGVGGRQSQIRIGVKKDRLESDDISGFKSWLKMQYDKGEPIQLIYCIKGGNYVTEELKDYNNNISCFEDGYVQIDYQNIMPEVELLYPQNVAAQLNSNSSSIASIQESLNLVWNAIFVLVNKKEENE